MNMTIIHKNKVHTIKSQIQIAIISISMIMMFLLGVSIFLKTTYRIEENYKKDFTYTLEKCDNIIKIQLDNIIELMRGLLADKAYISLLKDVPNDGSRYFSTLQINQIKKSTGEIILSEKHIQEIITVSMNGKIQVHSKRNDTSQYLPLYKEINILEQEWIPIANEQEGKEVIFGNNVLTGREDDISIVKSIIDVEDQTQVGYMIVTVSKKIFKVVFDHQEEYETISFVIRDENCVPNTIYSCGSELCLQKIMNNEVLLIEGDDNRYAACSFDSYVDGWTLFSFIQRDELNKQKKSLGYMIIIVGILLVIMSIIVSSRIAKRIYNPLAKLEQTILQVEEGEWNIDEEFDNSEIGMVGKKIKELITQTLQLREQILYAKVKQREQELYLLQQQINPHFLYNTLDALYSMAEIQGAEEIANMVDALSKTFRLSINKGGSIISVSDEIEHIQAYVLIQNMRFNNRFSLIFNVDENILKVKILNLILEPFVENAICHGLEPKIGKGKVEITGRYEKDGSILFIIKDDGIGVKDIKVMESGYGIMNVKERIQLTYGEKCGVWFESELMKGTTVYVKILELG